MKDGRTHLAHKAEHAVDLDTDPIGCGIELTDAIKCNHLVQVASEGLK
jgi:hypothetical protein